MEQRYIIPSVVLFATIVTLGCFAVSTNQKLIAGRNALRHRQEELGKTQAQSRQKQVTLQKKKEATTPANTFMGHWRNAIVSDQASNNMLSDLAKFGTDELVSVQGRKSGKAEYLWRAKPVEVQFADVAVSGEYHRLMNWLGATERAWPLARFEQIALHQNGPSLQLFVRLSYPSFLLQAIPSTGPTN
jgi:phosphate-selective porin